MSRITKLPRCCQWISWLAAVLSLAGCACQATKPGQILPPGRPPGVAASGSGFEGGPFAVVLPVQAARRETTPVEVLEQAAPALRAVGFQRNLADLTGPAGPLRLGPPDLKALGAELCREATSMGGNAGALCEAMTGGGPPSPAADRAIRNAYGLGFAEWKADLEKPVLQYPYSQTVAGVPIEGAGFSVFVRQGESPSIIHGSLYNQFAVGKRGNPKQRDGLVQKGMAVLAQKAGKGAILVRMREPELVLLPQGTAPSPVVGGKPLPALRYAWRTLVGRREGPDSWMIWTDASSGELLRVASQRKDATATASRWLRDPGLCQSLPSACMESVQLEITQNGSVPALNLRGVFEEVRLNVPSGPTLLSLGFSQFPPASAANDLCLLSQQPKAAAAFRMVNAYSHLYSLWTLYSKAGTFPVFPEKPLLAVVDNPDPKDALGSYASYDYNAGDALSTLWLVDGKGFSADGCPGGEGKLNSAQDSTVMAHEMAHLLVQRLQERRDARWCNGSGNRTCSLPDPLGHNILHDFADGLALSYAWTNCFAGWTAKNWTGLNANLHCNGPVSEAGGFPRKAELPADRFPKADKGEYANGQIAAAALWEIRTGMISKAQTAGAAEYWTRLLRSLWDFGFLPNTCSSATALANGRFRYDSCDQDVFLYLQDLERRMMAEWTAAPPQSVGRQTASKVLSGWAKAGLFLVPFACLDGDPQTSDPKGCPGKDTAAEPVIEIDDNAADDPAVGGVVHPEVDYLKRGGPAPSFRVWTGPRYLFSGNTADASANLCGRKYRIELAADPGFQTKITLDSPLSFNGCEDVVTLAAGDWAAFSKESKIYYRVKTWDDLGRERLSTAPGAGAFSVDPPFAVINDTGKP